MTTDVSGTQLLGQLETAIRQLVEDFCRDPYRCFTEADAHVAVQSSIAMHAGLATVEKTADGFKTGLVHREYPTFFRFNKHKPTRRLGPPARRGHYDLAILDPGFIGANTAETAINRSIDPAHDITQAPLLAAVEFKVFARAWSPDAVRGTREDLGKLCLTLQTAAHAQAVYLCVLQRDVSGSRNRWERYWPEVWTLLAASRQVRTVVAACWPNTELEPFVRYGDGWITAKA